MLHIREEYSPWSILAEGKGVTSNFTHFQECLDWFQPAFVQILLAKKMWMDNLLLY